MEGKFRDQFSTAASDSGQLRNCPFVEGRFLLPPLGESTSADYLLWEFRSGTAFGTDPAPY